MVNVKNLQEYLALKDEADAIKKKMDKLKTQIVADFEQNGETKFEDEKLTASLTYKKTYKIKDDLKTYNLLKEDEFLKRFIVTAIDAEGLKKEIKKSEDVAKRLTECYEVSDSASLSLAT